MHNFNLNKIVAIVFTMALFSSMVFSISILPTIKQVQGTESSGPWLEGWSFRKSHVVLNATGTGTNYPVRVVVDFGEGADFNDTVFVDGLCQADFGDVRFTEDDGFTELDYWLEDYTLSEQASFWVEISDDLSASNVTIYMYYGNSSVTTTSNQLTAGVLSLKEHRFSSYPSNLEFNQPTNTELRVDGTFSATYIARGYVFFVVPADWINGKYLRWTWDGYHTSSLNTARMMIMDGVYDRSSAADFPDGSALVEKGTGVLQSYFEPYAGTWGAYVHDVLVDVNSTSDYVTVLFFFVDGWAAQLGWLDFDVIEVNEVSGGAGNIVTEDFDVGSVVYEVTGTSNDYGLFRKYVDSESTNGTWGEQEEYHGWLEGWDYRKSHTLISADGAGANYQFKLNVNYGNGTDTDATVYLAGNCQPDFDDIRFTASDCVTLLDYWMQSKNESDNAVFWVEIAEDLSASNVTIYLYYGNSTVNSTSNGSETFIFFDDFEDDLNLWNTTGTTSTSADYAYEGSKSFKGGIDPSYIHRGSLGYTNASVHVFYWDNQTAGHETHGLIVSGASEVAAVQVHENVTTTNYAYRIGSLYYASNISRSNNWHEFCIRTSGGTRDFIIDDLFQTSSWMNQTATIDSISLGSWWTSNSANSYFDACFVRKYVSTEPTHGIWGAQESA